MSVTIVHVQLPSFSHSFSISISSDSTILDFKHEIFRTCNGSPNVAGQRVIYKGRELGDAEIVGEVWKATDEPHICHLAVHPSAWTAAPPSTTPLVNITPPLQPFLTPSLASHARPVPSNVPQAGATLPQMQPMAHATYWYIQYIHSNALRILARQPRLSWPDQLGDLDSARSFAKQGIESTGRGWPSYLNQDFPIHSPEQGADEGVKYTSTYIDNLPYLSLSTPEATPTALQTQAIRVLSYTFPLLCVYAPAQTQHSNPLQVNAILPRPLAPLGVAAQGAFLQLPIRPLIVPLVLLTIRTSLLLYFFQPARKPLFGLMVLIWVVWEVVGAVRGALGGENGNANGGQNNRGERAGAGAGAGGLNVGAGGAGAGGADVRLGDDNPAQPALPASREAFLNHLAHLNLSAEARFVESDSTPPDPNSPPPTLPHKVKMFCLLLFLTLHPAIWDRRRAALRQREGRVRDEARTREARVQQRERERADLEENRRRGVNVPNEPMADVAELPPAPRPFWVAQYMQRVRSGDWVDE